jgi:Leucine-rich repeat (LRR) protein
MQLLRSILMKVIGIILLTSFFTLLHDVYSADIAQKDDSVQAKRLAAIDELKKLVPNHLIAIVDNPDTKKSILKTVTYTNGKRGDEVLSLLKWFPEIEYLSLTDTDITSKGFENLKYLSNIKSLNVGRTAISNYDMIYLKDMNNLEKLYIGGTQISDTGIKNVASLINLNELGLSNTKITDEGLMYLKDLTKLERVNMANTNISDNGLVHLSGKDKLVYLDLSGTNVTTDGLLQMKGLDNLVGVNLSDTIYAKVKDSPARLKEAFPKLRDIQTVDYVNKKYK